MDLGGSGPAGRGWVGGLGWERVLCLPPSRPPVCIATDVAAVCTLSGALALAGITVHDALGFPWLQLHALWITPWSSERDKEHAT